MYLKLAWRNIWRNKRRTFITAFSIAVAVALSIFMRSQQIGSYDNMMKNTVGSFLGYVQVHQQGYWEEQNLDNTLEDTDQLRQKIAKTAGVEQVLPRIETYALLAGKEKSKAGMIIGMDTQLEKHIADPKKRMIQGKYFSGNDEQAVLLTEGLAKFLDLKVGDSLVIIGQGYQAMSAVGKYPIKGIVKLPTPDLNRSAMFMPLQSCQELLVAHERLTAFLLVLDNPKKSLEVRDILSKKLSPKDYEVMAWNDITPELEQMIVSDDVSGQIMIAVLYMIVAFGIFGTIIMMTAERRYEFGVLIGIGLQRWQLGLILFIETLFLAVIGTLAGIILIAPFVWYFYLNPIRLTGEMLKAVEEIGMEPLITYSIDPFIFINQGLIVFVITLVLALYPLWLTQGLKVLQAIRR